MLFPLIYVWLCMYPILLNFDVLITFVFILNIRVIHLLKYVCLNYMRFILLSKVSKYILYLLYFKQMQNRLHHFGLSRYLSLLLTHCWLVSAVLGSIIFIGTHEKIIGPQKLCRLMQQSQKISEFEQPSLQWGYHKTSCAIPKDNVSQLLSSFPRSYIALLLPRWSLRLKRGGIIVRLGLSTYPSLILLNLCTYMSISSSLFTEMNFSD